MHKLKNGAPAHQLTTEDRRKGAAATNEIRRAKRELIEQLEHNRWVEEELARRERRRQKRRERYRATQQIILARSVQNNGETTGGTRVFRR